MSTLNAFEVFDRTVEAIAAACRRENTPPAQVDAAYKQAAALLSAAIADASADDVEHLAALVLMRHAAGSPGLGQARLMVAGMTEPQRRRIAAAGVPLFGAAGRRPNSALVFDALAAIADETAAEAAKLAEPPAATANGPQDVAEALPGQTSSRPARTR